MFSVTILQHYLVWHYGRALVEFVRVYKNLWWFLVAFFSIPQLMHSLVSPFKRMTERRGRLFDLEAWASFIIINLMSRFIGAAIRLTLIVLGITSLLGLTILSLFCYAMWLIAPLLTVSSITYGIVLLF